MLDLLQHRAICVRLLAAYVFEADRTLKLLTSFKKFPLSFQKHQALTDQQEKENEFFEEYQLARSKLFELVLGQKAEQTQGKSNDRLIEKR